MAGVKTNKEQGKTPHSSFLILRPAYRRYDLPAEGMTCLPQVEALFHYRAHRLSADTTIVVPKYVVVLRLKLHEFRIVWGIYIERT